VSQGLTLVEESMQKDEKNTDSQARRPDLDNLVFFSAIAGIVGSFFLFGLFIIAEWANPKWNDAFTHFASVIGLPCAAAAAFVIIALFRVTEGRIKFEVIGFKFEGASGPIVMWVLCFLAIAAAIRMLWPLVL
jgi:hypothetical protein